MEINLHKWISARFWNFSKRCCYKHRIDKNKKTSGKQKKQENVRIKNAGLKKMMERKHRAVSYTHLDVYKRQVNKGIFYGKR